MSNITKEIKETYEKFKRNDPHGPVCESLPFSPTGQLWMYHYLYPEILLVYDGWVQQKYKRSFCALMTFEEYKKAAYITTSGEARIYPCWVLPEEEVLRVMEESGIL